MLFNIYIRACRTFGVMSTASWLGLLWQQYTYRIKFIVPPIIPIPRFQLKKIRRCKNETEIEYQNNKTLGRHARNLEIHTIPVYTTRIHAAHLNLKKTECLNDEQFKNQQSSPSTLEVLRCDVLIINSPSSEFNARSIAI